MERLGFQVVRKKSNTDRFAGDEDKVLDLLARVTTISVEILTVVAAIQSAMS